MQLYSNPYPIEAQIIKCPKCHKNFKVGNTSCTVMHFGDGCCHYGDIEILPKDTVTVP